jgi:hypothetical protein
VRHAKTLLLANKQQHHNPTSWPCPAADRRVHSYMYALIQLDLSKIVQFMDFVILLKETAKMNTI